jgi:DNA primase
LRCARRRIYLTEGEPDTLTAISLGFEDDDESLVVGRACAHGYPDPTPFKDREVVIIADPDEAGAKSAQKLLRLFGPIAAKVIAITPEQQMETDDS